MPATERRIRLPERWAQVLRTAGAPAVALPAGALELLVLQPSPFCNLDCDYCYLPERGNRARMPLERLDRILRHVLASGLVGRQLSVVWHAGEPMAVPRSWYEDAFAIVARHAEGRVVAHHFQTNAVLIDPAWCDFFARHAVRVGVSVDGPAALHDAHRRTREGRGTHARVMQGVAQLRAHGIGFHAIAVLTRAALQQPDAVYDFFAALGAHEVGFNVEEIEAGHASSTLVAADADALARRFWRRLLERVQAQPGQLCVRETAALVGALQDPAFGTHGGNAQNLPGRILSVGQDGAFCFWSPELLGSRHPRDGRLALGNLDAECFDWQALRTSDALRRWQDEIDRGIAACRASCRYFRVCLGGAPSNKLAELGTMAGSSTMACRLGLQAPVDETLAVLQAQSTAPSALVGRPG